MKRFPTYMIVAVCGILFLSAGMVIITADSTDQAAQPTLDVPTPTQVVSAPVDQVPPPVVVPTDVPPQPTAVPPVVQPTEVVIPTEVVQPVQPTAVSDQPVVPTAADASPQPQPTTVVVVPATAVPAGGGGGGNGGVVTPVIPSPSAPLGTLPPPASPVPTAANPVVIPTQVVSAIPAQVAGQVGAPLRADYAGIVVKLTLANGTALQTVTDSSGHFKFPNLSPGTYRLDAGAAGYLSSQIIITVTQGQNFVLPPVMLVGGDTNLDNKIDLTDAALVAANFDSSGVAGADLNHDGVVDIRDLTAIGAYFGRSGPTPWQP